MLRFQHGPSKPASSYVLQKCVILNEEFLTLELTSLDHAFITLRGRRQYLDEHDWHVDEGEALEVGACLHVLSILYWLVLTVNFDT